MTECVASLGPLCWTEEWKFYVWVVAMVIIWSVVIYYNYSMYKIRKRIKELNERIKRNGPYGKGTTI